MIRSNSLEKGLKNNPQAAKELEYWWPLGISAFVLGATGGGLVGIGLAANYIEYVVGGLGLAGAGYIIGTKADDSMRNAVSIHNKSLEK